MELFKKQDLLKECPYKESGVYFLYNNKHEVIYVGISTNCIRQRLSTHIKSIIQPSIEHYQVIKKIIMRKETVYFSYILMDKGEVKEFERSYIKDNKPKFNNKSNGKYDIDVAKEYNLTDEELLIIDFAYYEVDNVLALYKMKESQRIQQVNAASKLSDIYMNL